MPWHIWLTLSEADRAEIVAFYRLDHLIELHYQLQRIDMMNQAQPPRR